MPPSPIRIVLADDHPTFLTGLSSFLERQPGIELLATATDGRAALDLTRQLEPDVLVLDLEMPEMTGVEVAGALQDDPAQVLILSAYQDEDYIFGVLERGAAGYLTKQEPLGTILSAIQGIAGGETGWLSNRISDLVRQGRWRHRREPHLLDPLSAREREVAIEVARGHTNPEIAERLFISVSTVKRHTNAIYEKLDLKTRARVVAWMWEHGLVGPDDEG